MQVFLNISGKRNAFVSIQNGHTIACDGYSQPYVQTGYETVSTQRVDNLFCFTAKDKGKVISVTDKAVLVEYGTGERKGVYIGRQYGNAEGSTYPHDIVALLKEGDKFDHGDVIAYNTGFYEADFLNPKKVVMKFSMVTNVAYTEDPRTHEDSCSISPELATKLISPSTKIKSYVVRFTQNLHEMLKPGTKVEPDMVLMSIEDEITSGTGTFDAESALTLNKLGRMNPRAGYSGIIDKIEVFYHGDKIDMMPALKALADKSDKSLVDAANAAEKPPVNGRVSSDYRVGGKPLLLDTAEIRFYIGVRNSMSIGDKTVFANQLKSTVGETMDYTIKSESGLAVDALFGGRSVIKRIVNSCAINGTTIGVLQALEEKMIQLYEG